MATWATIEDLREWMDLPANAGDDATLQQVLDVAQAHQESVLDPDLLEAETVPPALAPEPVRQALLMRANALYRRRQTPEGISGVGDFAVVRVARYDPDVETYESRYRKVDFA